VETSLRRHRSYHRRSIPTRRAGNIISGVLKVLREETYTREPDRPLLDMQIHQIVHNPTLQVILNRIDDNLLAHIHNLQIRKIILVLINRLVHLFVVANTVSEILCSLLRILANIVGRRGLDFENIAHDQLFIVAFALNEQCLDSVFVAALLDPTASGLRTVRCVENGDDAALLEELQHICDGGFCGGLSHALSLQIIDIEEIGGWVGVVLSAVVAYIEDLGIDGQPFEVALSCVRESSVTNLPVKIS